jgi:hypothetical protein
MKKLFLLSVILLSASSFYGCLIFNKMSYTINIDKDTTGSAIVIVSDIRSDAVKSSDLEDDKKNLFTYVLKSPEFLDQMKDEGKIFTKRELFLRGDTLCGRAAFTFRSISSVEKIMYEDGFYFLTLTLDDSVLSTNGQIIYSKDRKRILWDNSFKQLKFEILGNAFDNDQYTKIASFYKP